jgi:hypothetical protein
MARTEREFIKRQLIEADRLSSVQPAGSFMARAWGTRRSSLQASLKEAIAAPLIPRTVLFFAGGDATVGSTGIDAQFVSEILKPFQEMVKSQFVSLRHGQVGQRGPRKSESEARLLLTALPRGSFGLELSQPFQEDWVTASEVSETLTTLSKVIEAAGKSDEDFANTVGDVSPRVLPRLKEFLEVAHKYKTSLTVESGDLRCELSAERVHRAFERASSTTTDTSELELFGVFRGATLDSWRFDFKPEGDDTALISGRISTDVGEEEAGQMNAKTNQRTKAILSKTEIRTPSGTVRTKYELNALMDES